MLTGSSRAGTARRSTIPGGKLGLALRGSGYLKAIPDVSLGAPEISLAEYGQPEISGKEILKRAEAGYKFTFGVLCADGTFYIRQHR